MHPPDSKTAGGGIVAGGQECLQSRNGEAQTHSSTRAALQALRIATRRVHAYCRIADILTEQRRALDHRVWREDFYDAGLAADVQLHVELEIAVADFLSARSAAR